MEWLIILPCMKVVAEEAHRANVDILVPKEASRDAECDAACGGRRSGTTHGQVQVAQAVGEGKACARAKKERSCTNLITSCYTDWRRCAVGPILGLHIAQAVGKAKPACQGTVLMP